VIRRSGRLGVFPRGLFTLAAPRCAGHSFPDVWSSLSLIKFTYELLDNEFTAVDYSIHHLSTLFVASYTAQPFPSLSA
jgi:hypothetical protein